MTSVSCFSLFQHQPTIMLAIYQASTWNIPDPAVTRKALVATSLQYQRAVLVWPSLYGWGDSSLEMSYRLPEEHSPCYAWLTLSCSDPRAHAQPTPYFLSLGCVPCQGGLVLISTLIPTLPRSHFLSLWLKNKDFKFFSYHYTSYSIFGLYFRMFDFKHWCLSC